MYSTDDQEPKHEWDLQSDFCIHCGLGRVHQVNSPRPCHRDKKVTAISHTRSKKRAEEILHAVRASPKSNNPNS